MDELHKDRRHNINKEDNEKYAGLTISELVEEELTFRIIIEDNTSRSFYEETDLDRLNIHVKKGVVYSVVGRG